MYDHPSSTDRSNSVEEHLPVQVGKEGRGIAIAIAISPSFWDRASRGYLEQRKGTHFFSQMSGEEGKHDNESERYHSKVQ